MRATGGLHAKGLIHRDVSPADLMLLKPKEASPNGLDPTGVGGCSAPVSFSADKTPLPDISFLSGLVRLMTVSVNGCGIFSLSPLQSAPELNSLTASENEISDLSPLAGLENMRTLKLNRNAIEDVSPLSGLTKLLILELNENK